MSYGVAHPARHGAPVLLRGEITPQSQSTARASGLKNGVSVSLPLRRKRCSRLKWYSSLKTQAVHVTDQVLLAELLPQRLHPVSRQYTHNTGRLVTVTAAWPPAATRCPCNARWPQSPWRRFMIVVPIFQRDNLDIKSNGTFPIKPYRSAAFY